MERERDEEGSTCYSLALNLIDWKTRLTEIPREMKEDQDAMEIALREEKERQESSFNNAFWKRSSKDKEEDKEEDELATALRPFQNHFASTASSLPKVSSSNVEQTQRRDLSLIHI